MGDLVAFVQGFLHKDRDKDAVVVLLEPSSDAKVCRGSDACCRSRIEKGPASGFLENDGVDAPAELRVDGQALKVRNGRGGCGLKDVEESRGEGKGDLSSSHVEVILTLEEAYEEEMLLAKWSAGQASPGDQRDELEKRRGGKRRVVHGEGADDRSRNINAISTSGRQTDTGKTDNEGMEHENCSLLELLKLEPGKKENFSIKRKRWCMVLHDRGVDKEGRNDGSSECCPAWAAAADRDKRYRDMELLKLELDKKEIFPSYCCKRERNYLGASWCC